MKVEVQQEQLLEAVSLAEKVSGRNLTLQVLNCILLSVSNKKLTIKATNLDIGIEIAIPVKVLEDGDVAVPSSVLYGAVSGSNTGKPISLSVGGDGNLELKTQNSVSTIKAQPHDDFPTIPRIKEALSFSCKPDIFTRGIKSVWSSASVSSIKPELSSIYIYQGDRKLYFVATDSFRLAEKSVPLEKGIPNFEPILIPLKNIPEIVRILERAKEEVSVTLTQNQISFAYDSVFLTSRLVDGAFPDYRQIIPKNKETEAVVLKQDLVNVLKKANIFTDSFRQVRFDVKPQKKIFSISSKNSDVGETTDNIHAALTGKDLEIGFNYKYIVDSFPSLVSDSVTLSFSGFGRPMVMRGVSDTSFLYLVMPMNK